MKVFQVTSKWTVFRIPIDESMYFIKMDDWLEENCSGPYKLFSISYGSSGNSDYGNGDYKPLLEVDLLSAVDVMAFKLRWL